MATVTYKNLPPVPGDVAGYLRQGARILPGTPGINPSAPDPYIGQPQPSTLEQWVNRFLHGITIFGPGGVFASPAPGQSPEAEKRAEETVRADQAQRESGAPLFQNGFCFGFDQTLCADAGVFQPACVTLTNLTCLGLGVLVLLALLGVGLHAIATG